MRRGRTHAYACHLLPVWPQVGLSPEVDGRLVALRDRVVEEVKVDEQLMELQGMVEPLLAASLAGTVNF